MRRRFDDPRRSRRRVLRAGGTALATGLAAFGAGCSSLPPLGTEVQFGTVDVPARSAPTYRDWLPAPAAFPDDSEAAEEYTILVHSPPGPDAPVWARSSLPRALVVGATDYVGFHVDEADLVVGTDNSAVLTGDVDRGTVADTIARTSYERRGTEGEYAVYARPDRDRVVGVGPDAVVYGIGAGARDSVAATVGAGRGDVRRYHEADEDVAALLDATGMRRWVWHWPGGIRRSSANDLREDTVGWAAAFDRRGRSAYLVETWVFPPAEEPSAGTIEAALKRTTPVGGIDPVSATAVDVSVDGRVATIAMCLGPDVVQEELADASERVPYTTWRSSHEGGRLTVRLDVGDAIPTDRLTFDLPGGDLPAADAGDVGDRVEPGDVLTVPTADLDAGATVRLVWRAPNGSSSTVLYSHELP